MSWESAENSHHLMLVPPDPTIRPPDRIATAFLTFGNDLTLEAGCRAA
jgi:hypothetical protein